MLRQIYPDAVDVLGPSAYTPAQVDAWRAFASQATFGAFILDIQTYVAVVNGEIVGFCGINHDGHIASIYVRPDRCGRGIGTTLLRWVLA